MAKRAATGRAPWLLESDLVVQAASAEIDAKGNSFTVSGLKEMKRIHEEGSTPMPDDFVNRAVTLYVERLEAESVYTDSITVDAMHVGILNFYAPSGGSSGDVEASTHCEIALRSSALLSAICGRS
jgi:hypothetical protein